MSGYSEDLIHAAATGLALRNGGSLKSASEAAKDPYYRKSAVSALSQIMAAGFNIERKRGFRDEDGVWWKPELPTDAPAAEATWQADMANAMTDERDAYPRTL